MYQWSGLGMEYLVSLFYDFPDALMLLPLQGIEGVRPSRGYGDGFERLGSPIAFPVGRPAWSARFLRFYVRFRRPFRLWLLGPTSE